MARKREKEIQIAQQSDQWLEEMRGRLLRAFRRARTSPARKIIANSIATIHIERERRLLLSV